MKKIFYILATVALMISMSSCQKEAFKSESEGLVVTAALSNGAATRVNYSTATHPITGLPGLEGTWVKKAGATTGDKLYGLWKGTSQDASWQTVTFECTDVIDGMGYFTVSSGTAPTDGATVNVVYAGSRTVNISTSGGSRNKATLSFNEQVGTLNTVGNNVVLWATATVNGSSLHFDFQPVVAVLKMNLTGNRDPRNTRYAFLKNVTNSITVDFSKSSNAIKFGTANQQIYLTLSGAPTINTTQKTFYAVIPAKSGEGSDYSTLAISACQSDKQEDAIAITRSGDKTNFIAGQFNEVTFTIDLN